MTTESARLNQAIGELRATVKRIGDLEAELERQKKVKRDLETNKLPDLFAELSLTKMTLDDGAKLALKIVSTGSLPKEPDKREKAIAWLVANDWEDVIKVTVVGKYGRGHREQAVEAARLLQASNVAEVTIGEDVHWMTLGKVCRDMLKKGTDVPLDMLGVEVLPTVKYKPVGETEDDA